MTTILAIGPHPDDVEGGMGGSILKLVAMGYDVHILDLTNGEPPPPRTPQIQKKKKEREIKSGIVRGEEQNGPRPAESLSYGRHRST